MLCSSAIKGPTSSKKLNLKAPEILNLIEHGSLQLQAAGIGGKLHLPAWENVLSHFLRSKSSLQHVVHGRCVCLGVEGMVTLGTRNGEALSAAFFIIFIFPLAPKYFCSLQKEVRCCNSPWMVFSTAQIHRCVSNKATKSITRSSLHGLTRCKPLLQRTPLTWGWMD